VSIKFSLGGMVDTMDLKSISNFEYRFKSYSEDGAQEDEFVCLKEEFFINSSMENLK
jgi:hypothetical protein